MSVQSLIVQAASVQNIAHNKAEFQRIFTRVQAELGKRRLYFHCDVFKLRVNKRYVWLGITLKLNSAWWDRKRKCIVWSPFFTSHVQPIVSDKAKCKLYNISKEQVEDIYRLTFQ